MKIDHRFNENNSVAFRYQIRFNNNSAPFAGGNLGIFGNRINDDRSLMGVDFTHLFTPTFRLEVHSGFSRNTSFENTVWAGRTWRANWASSAPRRNPNCSDFLASPCLTT